MDTKKDNLIKKIFKKIFFRRKNKKMSVTIAPLDPPLNSTPHNYRLPSQNGASEVNGERARRSRSVGHNSQKSREIIDPPSKGYNFSSHRRAIHDPNSVESMTLRLDIPIKSVPSRLKIPTKSAPASRFSSPVLSPRRLSNVDVFPSTVNVSVRLQASFGPEEPYADTTTGTSLQASPEKIHGSPDRSPLYSPAIKSSIPMSKNPSATQSPRHPKMYSDSSAVCLDNNVNVYPLPLPPGQNASKNEGASMKSQWQKQGLIGSGAFGNVYKAINRHTGALCAIKEVNIIPDDRKSAECLKQLEQLSGAAHELSVKGTPYWMAPEVAKGTMTKDVGYDFAADIWSLGCTIIEMFTGKHPWSELEPAAAMFKVLHKDPPVPETLSSEGKDFLQLCFRRNPSERPSANKLLDHPFIRNSNHYNLHGSIQAFAGIKPNEITCSPRDKLKSKSESSMKGRQSTNGEINHPHAETSMNATNVIRSVFSGRENRHRRGRSDLNRDLGGPVLQAGRRTSRQT